MELPKELDQLILVSTLGLDRAKNDLCYLNDNMQVLIPIIVSLSYVFKILVLKFQYLKKKLFVDLEND